MTINIQQAGGNASAATEAQLAQIRADLGVSRATRNFTRAEFDAEVAAERARIVASGAGRYVNTQRLGTIIGEEGTRIWSLATGGTDAANSAASHAKSVLLSAAKTVVLAADASVMRPTSGIPASGTGADGDQAIDRATGNIYTKTGGAWALSGVDGSGISVIAGVNQLGISIPAGWGAYWKAKLTAAKAGTGLARLAMPGDSLTAGQWASNLDSKSLAGLLRLSLQSVYGDGGSGFKSTYDSIVPINTAGYTGSVAAASLIALAGTWTVPTGVADGPGANPMQGGSNNCTATYTVRGTTVEVFVLQVTTGSSYTVTIDGAVNGPFASSGAAGIQRRTFAGLAAGNHVVVVTGVDAGSNSLFLNGVRGVNAAGVVIDKYGRGGYPSRAFKNGSNYTFTRSDSASIGGAANGTYAPAGSWSGGAANPCDLAVWSLGLNDARPTGNVASPDAYLGYLRDYLNDLKDGAGATGTTDVMIVMQHAGQLAFQDAATQWYAHYCERAADMARSYGAAYVNLWACGNNSYNWMLAQGYMGNSASAGTGGTDAVHLSDAGFQWQHDIIKPLIAL